MNNSVGVKDILTNMQKKYNLLNDFMNLTKEMEKALSYNDYVSLKMLLNMRQDNMKNIENLDKLIKKMILNLPEDVADRIYRIVLTDKAEIEEDADINEKLLYQTKMRTKDLAKKNYSYK